jgi:hypothetical protein
MSLGLGIGLILWKDTSGVKKWDGAAWAGLFWLMVGTGGESL